MTPEKFSKSLKTEALRLGFELAAICRAVAPAGFQALSNWIETGYHGEMSYFSNRQQAYSHPKYVLDGVKSILMLGLRYQGAPGRNSRKGIGQIAGYASAEVDYHDLIHSRLKQLGSYVSKVEPDLEWRGVVDTAPLLEREFATMAGLGWQAKNTMLINPQQGSYFFLAALLVNVELEFDEASSVDHCGTCRKCLDACPTNAFVDAHVLDATRCISYLTIELRNPIPVELRGMMGDWLFGCDVCQDVCPWNRFAQPPVNDEFAKPPTHREFDLIKLLQLDEAAFREIFRRTPMWRAKRRGLLRNAAIVLGNQRDPDSVTALIGALNDAEALVRGAAAWALGQMPPAVSRKALHERLQLEIEPEVIDEIKMAIETHLAIEEPAKDT